MSRPNIEKLIDSGFDIIKGTKGYYLGEREFEPSEISFLIDAVFSSKTISGKMSQNLAEKLSKFLSKYKQKNYKYIYKYEDVQFNSSDLYPQEPTTRELQLKDIQERASAFLGLNNETNEIP